MATPPWRSSKYLIFFCLPYQFYYCKLLFCYLVECLNSSPTVQKELWYDIFIGLLYWCETHFFLVCKGVNHSSPSRDEQVINIFALIKWFVLNGTLYVWEDFASFFCGWEHHQPWCAKRNRVLSAASCPSLPSSIGQRAIEFFSNWRRRPTIGRGVKRVAKWSLK